MNDPNYDELKKELVEISKIVNGYPDEIKSKVFDLLVNKYLGRGSSAGSETKVKQQNEPPKQERKKQESKTKKAVPTESYSIDRNLNLRGDGSVPPFKDFYQEKLPKSNFETNAVAVYYLNKILGMSEVTLTHVYTCYDEVKRKQPKAFKQSFTDTKNKKGWLEFDDKGNLIIPHRGVVFVEHDLPPAKPEK